MQIKINGIKYQANVVVGNHNDMAWNGRESKSITLPMSYENAKAEFVDDIKWSIIDDEGNEFNNDMFCVAGDITDHRNGTVTVKMGAYTDLEKLIMAFSEVI